MGLSQLARVLIRMVGLIVLARLLAPEIFGVVAIATAFATFGGALVQLGLSMAAAQAVTLSSNAKSVLFYVNLAMGVVISLIILGLAGPVGGAYGEPALVEVMLWMSFVPLLSGLQSQHRINLMREFRFSAISMTVVLSHAASVALAITAALLGSTYGALIVQVVTQPAFELLFLVMCSRWRPKLRVHWDGEINELFRVGLHVFGANALRNVTRNILVPVMGFRVSPTELGNFDRAQQLTIMPITLLTDGMQRVAVPTLTKVRSDKERFAGLLRSAHLFTAYVNGLGFLLLAAVGDTLVVLMLGPRWELAGSIVQILAIGAAFRAMGQASSWVFLAAGQSKAGLVFSLWSQPAVILVTFLGLPWGIFGVAVAHGVAWVLYWPISLIVAYRSHALSARLPLLDGARCVGFFAGPIAVAAYVGQGLVESQTQGLLVAAGAAALVACVSAAIFPAVRRDLRQLVRTARLGVRGR